MRPGFLDGVDVKPQGEGDDVGVEAVDNGGPGPDPPCDCDGQPLAGWPCQWLAKAALNC
jgi:hypothetical protein